MARAKKHEEEEHENHERWLVSYADMVTLLMVVFIVLFAMATVDARKFDALKDSLAGVKHPAPSVLSGAQSVIDGGVVAKLDTSIDAPSAQMDLPELPQAIDSNAASKALQKQQQQDAAKQAEDNNLEQVKQEIQASLQAHGLQDQVKFTKDTRGLIVSVVTDKVLFDAGKAQLRPNSYDILDAIGQPLSHLPNQISIEGHTDNTPIHTAQFDSNWELSTTRATSVLRYLVDHGEVASNRIGAVGYADQRPTVPNDSDAHRSQNRRVEVVILTDTQS
jgi:chemotaxis protein MotB